MMRGLHSGCKEMAGDSTALTHLTMSPTTAAVKFPATNRTACDGGSPFLSHAGPGSGRKITPHVMLHNERTDFDDAKH